MIIYYFYIIYASIISVLCREGTRYCKKRLLAILLWLGLFLIMGFRAEHVGNDLERYLDLYAMIDFININETRTESGYIALLKIFSALGIGSRGYILLTSFFISGSFAWFFYRYSDRITFTFLLHFLIGLFAFSLTGIRQTFAICLTLFAFHYSVKGKLFYFLLFSFLAISFHNSAVIFLPIYWLNRFKLDSYQKILSGIIVLIVIAVFSQTLISYIGGFSSQKYNDLYLEQGGANKLNFLPIAFQISQVLAIIMLWVIQKKNLRHISDKDLMFFNMSILSAVFVLLASNISTIGRLGFYFIPYINVLLPNVLNEVKGKAVNVIIQIAIYIICLAYFIIANTNGILKIDNYSFAMDVFG